MSNPVQATQIEILESQVMQLSDADRSHLLNRLIISLDKDPEVEASWEQEADRREAAIENGTAQWVPFDEAMTRIRARSSQ
jgi:putative addiction module component (TIGR02574 family)